MDGRSDRSKIAFITQSINKKSILEVLLLTSQHFPLRLQQKSGIFLVLSTILSLSFESFEYVFFFIVFGRAWTPIKTKVLYSLLNAWNLRKSYSSFFLPKAFVISKTDFFLQLTIGVMGEMFSKTWGTVKSSES